MIGADHYHHYPIVYSYLYNDRIIFNPTFSISLINKEDYRLQIIHTEHACFQPMRESEEPPTHMNLH